MALVSFTCSSQKVMHFWANCNFPSIYGTIFSCLLQQKSIIPQCPGKEHLFSQKCTGFVHVCPINEDPVAFFSPDISIRIDALLKESQ